MCGSCPKCRRDVGRIGVEHRAGCPRVDIPACRRPATHNSMSPWGFRTPLCDVHFTRKKAWDAKYKKLSAGKIRTHIKPLDEALMGGLLPGGRYLVIGNTGSGKTSLLNRIVDNIATYSKRYYRRTKKTKHISFSLHQCRDGESAAKTIASSSPVSVCLMDDFIGIGPWKKKDIKSILSMVKTTISTKQAFVLALTKNARMYVPQEVMHFFDVVMVLRSTQFGAVGIEFIKNRYGSKLGILLPSFDVIKK